jgi:methyl-accepting chemotaxis protein
MNGGSIMKWYRNIRISAKLIIGFLVVAAIGAFLGIFGTVNINRIEKADENLYKEHTLGVLYSESAGTYFQRLRYNALELTILDTDAKRKENVKKIEDFSKTIDDLLKNYDKRIRVKEKEDSDQLNTLMTSWKEYRDM